MRVTGATAMIVAILLMSQPVKANMLLNGDFDSITNLTDSDWGGTGWVLPAGANAGHTTWPAFNSTLGMYFPSWDNANNPGILYQDVSVATGQYTFSVWARRELNAKPTNLVIRLDWCDALTNILQSDSVSLLSLPNDTVYHQFHLTATCSSSTLSFVRAGIYGSWLATTGVTASLQFDAANLVAGPYKPELINAGFETPLGANDWVDTFWLSVPDYFANSRQPWAARHGTAGAVFEGYDTRSNSFSANISQPFYPNYGSNYIFGISLKRESTNMLQTNVELRIEWYDSTYTNQVQTTSLAKLGTLDGDNTFHDFYISGACTSPAVAEARVVLFGEWDENLLPAGGKTTQIDDARLIEGDPYLTYFNDDADDYRPTVELVPGTNVGAFFRADYATETNTTYVLVRQGILSANTGEVGTVGLRYAWDAGVANGGSEVPMSYAGSLTITNTSPFHGVPGSNAVVFDLYKAQWPMPQDLTGNLFTNGFSIYYSPFLVFTNIASTQEVEKIFLVKTGGSITNAANQQLNSQYVFNDYSYYNTIPSAPATLQNGGFETTASDNTWTNTGVAWIGFGGTERADWAFYSGLRGCAFHTWADDFGGFYQDVASTGGVYTLTMMFEKEPPVIMTTCEIKLEWYSSTGDQIACETNPVTTASDGQWHRLYMTVTNLHPNVAYVRPVVYADWDTPTADYANNDATRCDDVELYQGQLTNTASFTNGNFDLSPGTFDYSKWDGVMNDGPFDYVGIDNWADRTAPGGTNWGADFRGYKTNENTMAGSVSQGLVGQAPGSYVFSAYLKREAAMLLSNCELRISWLDKGFTNLQADTVLNVTTEMVADVTGTNWHPFAVTGTCANVSLYEIRVGVYATWGANLGGGNKAMMLDDAAFGPATDDSDADGLPDAWEMQNFGTLTNGPNGDVDGDGSLNWEEYVADTQPTNSGSFFQKQTNATENVSILQFNVNPTSPGRVYDVYWKTNLLDSTDWQPYGLSVTGNGGLITLTVTNSGAPYRIYRTGVHLPP